MVKVSQPVYLLVAVPGSGKTWVANQLKDKFEHVAHDDYQDGGYTGALIRMAVNSDKPVLAETPFSISQLVEPLAGRGISVHPIFILEHPTVISERYAAREGKAIPKGHLTRLITYASRAREGGHFAGTSEEVLEHLKKI